MLARVFSPEGAEYDGYAEVVVIRLGSALILASRKSVDESRCADLRLEFDRFQGAARFFCYST